MAHNWQRSVLRLMRVTNHPVTVSEITDLTPWYRRIVFSAPELAEGFEVFPTLWLRLWVPNPAKGDGFLSQRGYTVVDVDPERGTFALEFVLHDVPGPAGDWAKAARPGEVVEVALTPAHIAAPAGTSTLLLAGDVTALPAINSWIEAAQPDTTVAVFIEDEHEERDGLPLAVGGAGASWRWVSPDPGHRGAALARALIEDAPRQPSGLYAWAAGERTLVKRVRAVLKEQLQLERSAQFSQFYWIEGRATA